MKYRGINSTIIIILSLLVFCFFNCDFTPYQGTATISLDLGKFTDSSSALGLGKLPTNANITSFTITISGNDIDKVFLMDKDTKVLAEKEGSPKIAVHNFKKGKAVYLSGYKFTPQNTRLLHRALYWVAGRQGDFGPWTCSNIYTDCAYYPKSKKLIIINSSDKHQETKVFDSNGGSISVSMEPHGIEIINVETQESK